MQLRRNIGTTDFQPLEVTSEEGLSVEIDSLNSIIGRVLNSSGLQPMEINSSNIFNITAVIPPQGAFLLGRLTALLEVRNDLYNENRVIPWLKKPENN